MEQEQIEEFAHNWLYELENTNPSVLEKGYPLVPMKFGFIEGAKWYANIIRNTTPINCDLIFEKAALIDNDYQQDIPEKEIEQEKIEEITKFFIEKQLGYSFESEATKSIVENIMECVKFVTR